MSRDYTTFKSPIQHIDDDMGEIALCILSAVNVGTLKSTDDLEDLCDLAVRSLDEIIDYQVVTRTRAELSTRARRSLGVGAIRSSTLSSEE